jgi:hypothetical protein
VTWQNLVDINGDGRPEQSGFRDLNGDGIPDLIEFRPEIGTGTWTVRFGTGTRFSQAQTYRRA